MEIWVVTLAATPKRIAPQAVDDKVYNRRAVLLTLRAHDEQSCPPLAFVTYRGVTVGN